MVHLIEGQYIMRAKQPSIIMLPPTSLPIRLPTVEYLPSDTSEPKSR